MQATLKARLINAKFAMLKYKKYSEDPKLYKKCDKGFKTTVFSNHSVATIH